MKKIISLALILCMLLSVALPLSVYADEGASVPTAIDTAAAQAYWDDATTGQFIVNADATVYEISTAEQLLGLSLAMENNSNDQTWTEGKTFKLTADIDLNPGVDWAAYKAAQLEGTEYTGVAPVNEWRTLDNFYGSFDGDGHTISGLWTTNSDSQTGDVKHYGVFGGSVWTCEQADGSYSNSIKNVTLDNGYIKGGNKGQNGLGGVVGVIRMRVTTESSYTLENITIGSNYTVDGKAKPAQNVQIGGIAVGWYNNVNGTMTINYNNVKFAGHVEGSTPINLDGVFAGIWRYQEASGAAVFNVTMTDCVFSGTKNNVDKPEFTNEGTTATNCTIEPQRIDTAAAEAYWTDETTGQFIANATATTYEISTAEQLLGLSLAMENNSNDQTWTEGKTFKLTADIDLNPGVDWAAYKASQLNGTEYTGVVPVNEWKSLDAFYGSIDGDGHTISGLWTLNSDSQTGDVAHYGVFGGSAFTSKKSDETYSNSIVNIVLDNGYLKAGSKGNAGFAGVVGVIRMNVTGESSYTLKDITIGENYTVDGRAKPAQSVQIGGIVIGWYNNVNGTMAINYDNVVFSGHLEGNTSIAVDGVFAGIWRYQEAGGAAVFNVTMTDCVFSGTKNNVDKPEFTNQGTTATNCTIAIKRDVSEAELYWTDETTGQFIVNAEAEVYEISTAEQLLGLSLAMENNGKDKEWTEGKIFKLTADIDLNPGVDWIAYKAAQLDTEVEYTGTLPTNEWLSLDCFYGSFDGQGHTISGIWTPAAGNGIASDAAEWGVFGGRIKGLGDRYIKNIVLDNGYVKGGADNNALGGVVGCIYLDEDGSSFALENIYLGKNYTVDTSLKTKPSSSPYTSAVVANCWNSVNGTMDITLENVVMAGHFIGNPWALDGVFFGYWRGLENQNGGNYNISMTDCVILGTYSNDVTISHFGGTKTNCYNFGNGKEQSIPADLAGKWIETTEGVMPVAVADMLTKYYMQATVVDTDGKYSIRVIGEVASLAYESVDFKVTLTDSEGVSTTYGYGATDYETAKVVYNTINAGGAVLTANDFNEGVLDGEGNKMYAFILDGLDSEETYTLSVSTVWTLTDGSVAEGSIVKTITPSAWIAES